MSWNRVCAAMAANISLQQLDDELERIPYLTEDERSAIWLYAWSSRDTVARVAALPA